MSMKERKIQASLIIHRVTRHSEAKAHSVQVQRERERERHRCQSSNTFINPEIFKEAAIT